jgi:hypothetical protein
MGSEHVKNNNQQPSRSAGLPDADIMAHARHIVAGISQYPAVVARAEETLAPLWARLEHGCWPLGQEHGRSVRSEAFRSCLAEAFQTFVWSTRAVHRGLISVDVAAPRFTVGGSLRYSDFDLALEIEARHAEYCRAASAVIERHAAKAVRVKDLAEKLRRPHRTAKALEVCALFDHPAFVNLVMEAMVATHGPLGMPAAVMVSAVTREYLAAIVDLDTSGTRLMKELLGGCLTTAIPLEADRAAQHGISVLTSEDDFSF